MNRRLTDAVSFLLPVAALVLAIASGVALLAAPGDVRAELTAVLVALLATVAVAAAWRHRQLAQHTLALQEQLAQRKNELDKQTARLMALHDLALRLGSPLRLEEVLLQGAERVKTVLEVDAAHIHLICDADQTLKLETAVGAPVSFLAEEASLSVGECVCGLAAATVLPIVVKDLSNDPRATRLACKRHGYCTVASVPLRSRDRALGILTVNAHASRDLSADDMDMLTALGNQLGAAVENTQLYNEMERRVQELTRKVEHLVVVQERERISREIHDGVAQALALLNLRVNVASSLLVAGQTEQARKELDQAAEVIDAANRDVREAITALRLTSPKGVDFAPTLADFVSDFGLRNDIQTEFAADGARAVLLAPTVETQLMRVIQEALANVRKHAHARQAQVTLKRRSTRLQVSIQDNGRGFDMDEVLTGQNKKNFGLTTMRERVEGIGGTLDVQTQIGGGTRIIVSVPCQEPAPTSDMPIHETTD